MNLWEFVGDASAWTRPDTGILARLGEHLLTILVVVAIATPVGSVVGLLLGHRRRGTELARAVAVVVGSVSTLGLVVAVAQLAAGSRSAVAVALAVLATMPIMVAVASSAGVAPDAVRAARALGLTPAQVLVGVELPAALPMLVRGVRAATLLTLGAVTVAAYTGFGGLGRFVVDGQQQGAGGYPQMFAGVAVLTVLAMLLHLGFGVLARQTTPPGHDRSPLVLIPVPTG